MSSGSNRKAIAAQKEATNATIAEQRRQYDQTRKDYMPYMQSGYAAQNALNTVNGLPTYTYNSDGSTTTNAASGDTLSGFKDSAWYQLLNNQDTIDSTNAAFSAKGMGLDGAAQKALAQGLYSNQSNALSNYVNALSGTATSGSNATGAITNSGSNMANAISNANQNYGNYLASSYQGRANNIASMQNGLYKLAGQTIMSFL